MDRVKVEMGPFEAIEFGSGFSVVEEVNIDPFARFFLKVAQDGEIGESVGAEVDRFFCPLQGVQEGELKVVSGMS